MAHRLVARSAGAIIAALGFLAAAAAPALAGPVPDPGTGSAPPGSQGFITIMGWSKWVALGLCVIALIGAGAMMGFGNRHGDGGQHVERIGRVLAGVCLISAAYSLVGFLVA